MGRKERREEGMEGGKRERRKKEVFKNCIKQVGGLVSQQSCLFSTKSHNAPGEVTVLLHGALDVL